MMDLMLFCYRRKHIRVFCGHLGTLVKLNSQTCMMLLVFNCFFVVRDTMKQNSFLGPWSCVCVHVRPSVM
jgi:hypothetical protein